jgi:LacI family transcriptional regulator
VAIRRQTSLKDLASELGVSITTVSRALADYPDVSAETRARVKTVARERGYVPSWVGRMLVSGRTDFIGMVVPLRAGQIIDAFLGEYVVGLSEGLAVGGRDLFLATATGIESEFEVLRHIVDGNRADAIVLYRTEIDDPRVQFLKKRGVPFISHGRVLTDLHSFAWFDTDGEAAFAEAARRLIALGHRRFGLVTVHEPYSFAHVRRNGLETALAQAGLALAPHDVVAVPMLDRSAATAAAEQLLARADRPTAVLGITDLQALAVLDVAERRGIAVPGQLSVIGFDDVPVSAYARPALSTFNQRTRESARTIAGMLMQVMETDGGGVPSQLVKAEFVPRGSHGPAPD